MTCQGIQVRVISAVTHTGRLIAIPGLLLAWLGNACAQPAAPAASPAPSPYIDRVLDSGPQEDEALDPADQPNAEGWPRSLRLEYALSSQHGPSASLARALAFSGFLDTPNHGALSVAGNVIATTNEVGGAAQSTSQTRGHTWRIEQRAMPLDGGWLANHGAGDISTITPALARNLGRIVLPTTPIAGAAGIWTQGDNIGLNASVGRAGLFSGVDIAGFDGSSGQIASAGGQMRLGNGQGASRTDGALQVVQAQHIAEAGLAGGRSTRSTWGSLAWQGPAPWGDGIAGGSGYPVPQRRGGLGLQANWLQSTAEPGGTANGFWLDGAWRGDLLQNSAGLFRLDPNLRWGPSIAASDVQGIYWRADMSAQRWQLAWSAELDSSVSGLQSRSAFGNLTARYRLNTRHTVGAAMALRSGLGAAQSVQLNWDQTSDLGQTQWRGSTVRNRDGRTVFLGVDQIWAELTLLTLSTSLGWQQAQSPLLTNSAWNWGVLAGFSPFYGLSIDGSLRGARGAATDSLNVSLAGTWQIRRNWSLALRYNEARGQDLQLAQVVSALTAASQVPAVASPAFRSIQLVLRYEQRSGSATAPIGGLPGSGAGGLAGTVFLDANGNGRRDASEAGVPNILIVLDRRFITRTDAQGRYEFPAVVAGPHELQVQIDNVPLPWSPETREPVKATVMVRDVTVTDFALKREP